MNDVATRPTVDIRKCDGDGRCVDVCPGGVFELYALSGEEVEQLPFLARLKVKIKGVNKSRSVNALDCIACGLCVEACHERAIELVARSDDQQWSLSSQHRTRPFRTGTQP